MTSPPQSQHVELKLARLRDAAGIAGMSRELVEVGLPWSWSPRRVSAHIRSATSNVLTAWKDGQLVGFAIVQFFDEYAHLNLLAVAPAARRLGVGRKLLDWQAQVAMAGGVYTLSLEVRAGNAGACAFYRRLGFHSTKYIPGYYSGREAAMRMARDLRSG